MVEANGLEPFTPCLQSRCSTRWAKPPTKVVGQIGIEPMTPALSTRCSNQLSYWPISLSFQFRLFISINPTFFKSTADECEYLICSSFSWKEVIQPQVPLRLPCYDFTPVMNHTVANVPPKVKLSASGATHSHGVTGGVYKARERIHRDMLIRDY